MFKEDNNEYWKKFANLIQADFEEIQYWHSAKAISDYKGFKTIFDNYAHSAVSGKLFMSSIVTRIYCQFYSENDLTFKILPDNYSNRFVNLFNKKIKIPNENYVVYSNNQNLNETVSTILKKTNALPKATIEIGNNEGIWGNQLDKNIQELSVYFDSNKIDYKILIETKNLVESAVNQLIEKFQIKRI